jgi:hypothetical protein
VRPVSRRPSQARVEALRAHLAAQRAEGARLREALRAASISRDLALELLRAGDGAAPLALLPWLAAVFATLAAIFAVFCAYVTAGSVAPTWTTLGLLAVVAASVAGLVARGPGAGGRARGDLRRLATFLTVLSAIVLLLAAHR